MEVLTKTVKVFLFCYKKSNFIPQIASYKFYHLVRSITRPFGRDVLTKNGFRDRSDLTKDGFRGRSGPWLDQVICGCRRLVLGLVIYY